MPPRPWEPAFVEIVRRSGQIKLAAECAGVHRFVAYKRMKRDESLAAKVAQAKADYAESVMTSACVKFRRAG